MIFFEKQNLVFSIQGSSLKIAIANYSSGGFKISYLKKITDPLIFAGDEVIDTNKAAALLQKIFNEELLKQKYTTVIWAIPENKLFFKQLSLEQRPKDALELINLIEKDLPFEKENTSLVWEEISKGIFQICATEAKLISKLSFVIKDTFLNVFRFVPAPLTILEFQKPSTQAYLLTFQEERSATFLVVVNKAIEFSSSFDLKEVKTKEIEKIALNYKEYFNNHYQQSPKKLISVGKNDVATFFTKYDFEIEEIPFPVVKNKSNEDYEDFKSLISASSFKDSPLSFEPESFKDGLGNIAAAKVEISEKKPIFNFLPVLLGLGLAIILVTLAAIFLFFFKTKQQEPATPVAQTSQTATSSATNEATDSAQEQPLERANLKIKILNGRGVAGTAADAKEFLTNLGWQVTEVDNASSFDFAKTQIQIKESRLRFLGLLTKDLENRYTIIEGEKLSETESFDALITIGKE